jgi:hypothetical protein
VDFELAGAGDAAPTYSHLSHQDPGLQVDGFTIADASYFNHKVEAVGEEGSEYCDLLNLEGSGLISEGFQGGVD